MDYEWNENPTESTESPVEAASENTYCPPEPVEAPEQPTPIAPPVRKPSPFANSPYVTVIPAAPVQEPIPEPVSCAPEQEEEPDHAEPATNSGKKSKLHLPTMIAVAGAFVLIASTFAINNHRINALKADYESRLLVLTEKLERVEENKTGIFTPGSNGPSRPVTPSADGSLTPAEVYAQCAESVVGINCTGAVRGTFGQIQETASTGSGFILSDDGYIVTNFHVVEGQQKLEVITNDGTKFEAEYIGGNEANDIALLKVDGKDLPYVNVGSVADMAVGDQVVAIGNPLGELHATLTVGYLSAKDRIVSSDGSQINMLQTDAAINPGNSGGPLFNMYGQVVGITSAKYSGTTSSGASIEGIGFAIPMDDVMTMLDDLRNHGYITGGYLGVSVSEVGEDASELYGLPKGVLVREVHPGSCAENAGIRVQDIIVSVAGFKIESHNDLTRALNKCKGGQEVTVTVYRSGAEKVLTVILDERPHETEPAATEPVSNDQYIPWPGGSFFDDWFGSFFG